MPVKPVISAYHLISIADSLIQFSLQLLLLALGMSKP